MIYKKRTHENGKYFKMTVVSVVANEHRPYVRSEGCLPT
jgi:hypothetical protein